MKEKKSVLFVDDEPKVLSGLRRMLRPMRREWEMSFAEGGQKALDILDRKPFDVLVTDMRMPGMDGAELLEKVREQHPEIIRIVLSGQADRETILRAVGLIHQYMSKPCDAEALKSTLSRALALSDLLADDRLKQLISQMGALPSLPSLYHEMMEELQSPNASISAVGQIISQDMGMSAKVLQLVNSVFFGLRHPISNPAQAVDLLGLDTIKLMVLSVHMFYQFDQTQLDGIPLTAIWNHSVAVGGGAKRIAEVESDEQKLADDAFMGGLLHDAGKLVLASNLPEEYHSVCALASGEGLNLSEAEYETFGASHAEVGAYLLELWGLPGSLTAATAFHHNPMEHPGNSFNPLTVVHVANALTHEAYPTKWGPASTIDHTYLTKLGLTERLPVWREICLKTIQGGDN